jgi:hypothetical protein
VVELLCTVLRKLYTAFPLSDTARPPEAQKLQQVGLMAGWLAGWMDGWMGHAVGGGVVKVCML